MHKQCLGKSGFTPSMGKKKKQSRQSLLNYLPLQNDALNPISTSTLEKQCCLLFFFLCCLIIENILGERREFTFLF